MDNKNIITYRPDIDGLRALAVLLVVAFHASPTFFKGGFIGVDIFFVISGFLITGIILKSLDNNEFSYLSFYKRRIKRLFPALIVVLFTCLIGGWLILFSQEYLHLTKHVISGAGFVSNIIYYLEAGYFDISSSLKPLIHLWSLGVEEQFYIFWPILLVFLYKRSKKILLIISLLLALSFLLNILFGLKNPSLSFYIPVTRFWEFLSGALIAYINFSNNNFFNCLTEKFNILKENKIFISNLVSWLGLMLIIISLFIINSDNFYKGHVIILILGVSLLIVSGKKSFINRFIFANKILVFIGLISYPLYLWHWPLFSFARIFNGEEISALFKILLILLSFVLAWITYVFIEKPFRKSNNKQTPLILCFLVIFVVILSLFIIFGRGFPSRLLSQEKLLETISLSPSKSKKNVLLVNNYNNEKLCNSLYKEKKLRVACMAPNDFDNKVIIIGDSHTTMVYYGYKDQLENRGYSLIKLGISGCPFSSELPSKKWCNVHVERVMDIVNKSNPKAIIISHNAMYNRDEKYFESGMEKTISQLPSNIPIIWILQTPKVPFNLTKCLNRNIFSDNYLTDCSFSREYFDKRSAKYLESVEKLKKQNPKMIIINPVNVICSDKRCEVIIDNNYVYEDLNSHISSFGSKYIAEKLPLDEYLPDLKKEIK